MKIGYSSKVMELFMHPKNVGKMEDASVTALTGSVACGDMIKLYLKINPRTEIIENATFESYGCAANIATSSMLTELIKGKSVEEVRKIAFQEVVEDLGGLPKIKFHCAVLAVAALRLALEKWDHLRGRKELNEDFVKNMLRGILDPHTERDLIAARAVNSIIIKGSEIRVYLSIPQDEFTEEIVSSIMEVFETLPVKVGIFLGGEEVAL